MKQQLIQLLMRYRFLILMILFASMLAYGLLRLQLISNPRPDPNYTNEQQSTVTTGSIKVKDSLQEEINKLVDTPVNVEPDVLGRSDPFNP